MLAVVHFQSTPQQVPAGYKYNTLLVASDNVTSAMKLYGEILMKYYKKDHGYRKSDFSINYLGWECKRWSDFLANVKFKFPIKSVKKFQISKFHVMRSVILYCRYWTDNGACYYYYSGNYDNYEDALEDVKKDADQKEIPYRYVQLDSWWYFKGRGDGVKNWTAMPSVFPNGIQSLQQKTQWPIVAHNRYWYSTHFTAIEYFKS